MAKKNNIKVAKKGWQKVKEQQKHQKIQKTKGRKIAKEGHKSAQRMAKIEWFTKWQNMTEKWK